ncbi:MAG: hypothetical protein VX438_13180 [Planctomycetota bacterium]|jgi:hypothetical protein|nr:hypothetical protein [Planctomycetota bacterium]
MNTRNRVYYGLVLGLAGLLFGCYQRSTAPSYSFDPSEVSKIRQQLGVQTANEEFFNEEDPLENAP